MFTTMTKETLDKRIQVVVAESDIQMIEKIRAATSPIPSRSQVVREGIRELAKARGVTRKRKRGG